MLAQRLSRVEHTAEAAVEMRNESCLLFTNLCHFEGQSVLRFRTLFVAGLFAVGHDLGSQPEVLLGLHSRERMAEALVLDYRRVADALILAEDAVGKHVPSPADFQRLVPVIEQLHVLACKALCHFGLLKDDLLAVVVELSCAPT